jgi:hypothetical protein
LVKRGEPSLSRFCFTYKASIVSASLGVQRTLARPPVMSVELMSSAVPLKTVVVPDVRSRRF